MDQVNFGDDKETGLNFIGIGGLRIERGREVDNINEEEILKEIKEN